MEIDNDITTVNIGTVYLNALTIALSKPDIPTIEIEVDKEAYSGYVKQLLRDTIDIAYWTPRRGSGIRSTYISYVTSINSPLDNVRVRLEKLKDKISIVGEKSLRVNHNSVKILENAIMKRFINMGWHCSERYGNIVCYLREPFEVKHFFAFHKAVEFRVIYVNNPVLILRPSLRVFGPSLRDLINEHGENILQRVLNRECIALRKSEGRYRKAMILNVRKVDIGKYVAKVIFYDGIEAEVSIEDVRLAGNVLFYKKLIVEVYGEQAFKQLEKLQRTYSFSLGPKESSFELAKTFGNEILNIVKSSGVFPFKLGEVSVDIKSELFRVK